MFLRRLVTAIEGRSGAEAKITVLGEERFKRLFDRAYALAYSRPPTGADAAAALSKLRTGEQDLLDVLEALPTREAYDYRCDPKLTPMLSSEVLHRSEALCRGDALSRAAYERLYRERFESGRELIVGQAEYGPQHKERFREMFSAAAFLLQGRSNPRVLEFGASEFSAFFKSLLPEVALHLSDRPAARDYIGFTEAVARRISGCDDYRAIDLEGGVAAIRDSGLAAGRYDLIVFAEVLEHLDVNPVEMLEALLALLTQDGFIYLTTPNFFRRENLQKIARRENPQEVYPALDGNWDRHHHHREYAANELLQFVATAGGQIEAFYFSSCWDTEPLPPLHERANLVCVIRRSR